MNYRYSLLVAIIFLAMVTGCSESSQDDSDEVHFTCGAENAEGDKLLASNDFLLSGKSARTAKKSRTGKYSLRLNADNPYGFGYTITGVKKGDVIEASVWKNLDAEHGAITIGAPNNAFYESTGNIQLTEGDWGKMNVMFVAQRDWDSLTIYTYNLDKKPVYFDDLEVHVYRNNKKPEVKDDQKALYLEIPQSALDSLNDFRETAMEQGVISDDLKDYVHASVLIDGESAPVEMRLKGDWTDHVESEKVSYRIKMGDGFAFNGLRSFSVQNPRTRSFMMEWFAHKMFENEDILTTTYELIPVFINGENAGIYALEEHFDKQLLEARHRREGPIMKFDESGIWQVYRMLEEQNIYMNVPAFESAEISVFKKGRTKKNPVLFGQLKVALSKMEQYRQGDSTVDTYFDVEALAKYLAMTEVVNGKHALIWHNQRHYFNPITQRLEPIAYDCFTEPNMLIHKHEFIAEQKADDHTYELYRKVLSNPEVYERYIHYLNIYSSDTYLKKVFRKFKGEIDALEKLIQFEYPNVKLEKSYFEYSCREIRKKLPKLNGTVTLPKKNKGFQVLPENVIFTEIALKANLERYNADSSVQMSLRNYHSHPIEIIGYSTKENKGLIVAINPIRLDAFGKSDVAFKDLPRKPRRLFYRADNCGTKIFKCNPEEWPMPKIGQEIGKHTNVAVSKNGEVTLSGNLVFDQDLVIPKCKRLIIEAGTTIDLKNGAALISHAPAHSRGTEQNPVLIQSSDQSSNGFIVLSPEKSKLVHTNFDHLGSMNKNGWTLTGALTFYNAYVELKHCNFTNNHSEDALNTVRCRVYISDCRISNTLSDGYDADFCTGVVRNSQFENTGNDCIDFSGSRMLISECAIKNSGDKGISGGENSELYVSDCTIDGANIAIASKDKSYVRVETGTIKNSNYAFSAYRKKPEYGPARLKVLRMRKNKAKNLHLLEKGSTLTYDSKKYVGKEVFDIDSLYAEFNQ